MHAGKVNWELCSDLNFFHHLVTTELNYTLCVSFTLFFTLDTGTSIKEGETQEENILQQCAFNTRGSVLETSEGELRPSICIGLNVEAEAKGSGEDDMFALIL